MTSSHEFSTPGQQTRGIDGIPDVFDTFQRSESSSSNNIVNSPTKSLNRSISNSSASSPLVYSSDRAFNTIKHIAAGVKRKGRHLRIKSDSTPSQIPSQPLISPPGAPPSSAGQASYHPVIHQQHPQHLLVNSFSQQLAIPAPSLPVPPKSPPPLSLQLQSPGDSTSLGSPARRRPSFRHENYPRRPIMQSMQDSISTNLPMSSPALRMDLGVDLCDLKVPALLQQGTPMLKISSKQIKSRMVRLDADLGQIQWQSKKSGVVIIDNIKEIRSGAETRYYREHFRISEDKEPLWLTIIYTAQAKYKTLHLIAFEAGVFRLWDTTLRRLFSFRQNLLSGLGGVEQRDDAWEKQYWKDTDMSGDHRADFAEIERLCRRLNISTSSADLLNVFMESDSHGRGYLEFADFRHFVALLKARPDINALYEALKGDTHQEFTFVVFEHFMHTCQHSTHTRPELVKLFDKFATRDSPSNASATGQTPISLGLKEGLGLSGLSLSVRLPVGPLSPSAPHAETQASCAVQSSADECQETQQTMSSTWLPIPSPIPSWRSPSLPATPDSLARDITASDPDSNDLTPMPNASHWPLSSFTAFLLSSDNSPFPRSEPSVHQDMTRPLAEYFISSSHNTYLVGNQLVGDSTVEGYIRALLHGCRSVELDIWDGEEEPAIYHGRTLTSKVSLTDVARAISRYAFVASPYPIIISAEIHCSLKQQDQAAEIIRREFGDALVTSTVDGEVTIEALPSPERLKRRILFKAKNLYATQERRLESYVAPVDAESSPTGDSQTEMSEFDIVRKELKDLKQDIGRARSLIQKAKDKIKDSTEPAISKAKAQVHRSQSPPTHNDLFPTKSREKEKEKVKMSLALASLTVYTVGVKCRGINKKERYAVEHVFSLSERTANKILKESMGDLVKHNRTHLVRVYPKGTRLNSSNYEPHRYWASGAQLVAINWQTFDLGYMMNYAMFQRNGKSGYVLKPDALRVKDKEFIRKRTKHFLDITIISAQQLPRPKLVVGKETDTRYTIDPYVEVSVHVPDWSTSPFLPVEEGAVSYSPPRGGNGDAGPSTARTISHVTSAVKNNGWNPVWQELISIPFDCVGDMMDVIFVKLQVKDEYNGEDIACFCAPLGSLRQGFRHLPLHDKQLSQFLFSTLFVQINIRDVQE